MVVVVVVTVVGTTARDEDFAIVGLNASMVGNIIAGMTTQRAMIIRQREWVAAVVIGFILS